MTGSFDKWEEHEWWPFRYDFAITPPYEQGWRHNNGTVQYYRLPRGFHRKYYFVAFKWYDPKRGSSRWVSFKIEPYATHGGAPSLYRLD